MYQQGRRSASARWSRDLSTRLEGRRAPLGPLPSPSHPLAGRSPPPPARRKRGKYRNSCSRAGPASPRGEITRQTWLYQAGGWGGGRAPTRRAGTARRVQHRSSKTKRRGSASDPGPSSAARRPAAASAARRPRRRRRNRRGEHEEAAGRAEPLAGDDGRMQAAEPVEAAAQIAGPAPPEVAPEPPGHRHLPRGRRRRRDGRRALCQSESVRATARHVRAARYVRAARHFRAASSVGGASLPLRPRLGSKGAVLPLPRQPTYSFLAY
jgi:hypothetical protein